MNALGFFNTSKSKKCFHLFYSEKMKLFRAYVHDLLETHYLDLGFNQTDENEAHMQTLSRISANEAMCKLDYPDCVQKATEVFASWLPSCQAPGVNIPADIKDVVLNTAIRSGEVYRWSFLLEKFQTETVDSNKKKYLVALAQTEDVAIIGR